MKNIIIFLAVLLSGANLININFFQQKNKLDILFSLDGKFNGKAIKNGKNQFLITGINSDKEYAKKFGSFFLKKITISPSNNSVLIKLNAKKYKTSVALTPDGYGLRFRITNLVKKPEKLVYANTQSGLDYFTYFISLLILIILAVILYIFRKKILKKLPVKGNIAILFQKPIDTKNKVALVEFNKRKYLLLIGNTNILLDVFDENMVNVKTQKDFDTYLKKDPDKLDHFKQYIENAEKLKDFDEKI